MTHTPGPFGILQPKKTGGSLGDPGDRGIYAETKRGNILIGEAFQDGNAQWTKDRVPLPAQDNALLWAAAPAMLEALEDLHDAAKAGGYLNAAIEKAATAIKAAQP